VPLDLFLIIAAAWLLLDLLVVVVLILARRGRGVGISSPQQPHVWSARRSRRNQIPGRV